MMEVTNKTKTARFIRFPFLDSEDPVFLPITKAICSEIGIALDDLLRMRFVIKLIDGRIVLEGLDQDASSTDSLHVRGGES